MTNKTAVRIVGGVAIGTVAAGAISIIVWNIIPITVWSIATTVIGAQTMNVLRVKSGQLQPVVIKKERETSNVVPIRKDEEEGHEKTRSGQRA